MFISTPKHTPFELSAKQSYLHITDAINYLEIQYKRPYTEDDIDDFISRGVLTPCFPYEGTLLRTYINSSDQLYDKISYFKGFIKAGNESVQKSIGELSTKYKNIFILEVGFCNETNQLQDYETFEEYNLDHKHSTLDDGMLELSVMTFYSQDSGSLLHYKTTKLCDRYKFDGRGIEINKNTYRSYCHFHLDQLSDIANIYPKSNQGSIANQSAVFSNCEEHELAINDQLKKISPRQNNNVIRVDPVREVMISILANEPCITQIAMWDRLLNMAENAEPPFLSVRIISNLEKKDTVELVYQTGAQSQSETGSIDQRNIVRRFRTLKKPHKAQ